MKLATSLFFGSLLGLAAAQKGHYIRPLVESHYPAVTYGVPVYEEVPVVPRVYPGIYQTHASPQFRSRKTNRAEVENAGVQPKASSPPSSSVESVPASDNEEPPRASAYPILSYSNQMGNEGDYSYKYETADGVKKEETSILTTSEDGKTARSVRGSYSYPTADGRMIRVDYVADEGGFRATTVSEGESSAGVGTTFRRVGERGFVYSYKAPRS